MHMFALMLGDRPFWCVFLERGGEGECSVYWGDYATPGVDVIFRWVSMVVDHGGILGEGDDNFRVDYVYAVVVCLVGLCRHFV